MVFFFYFFILTLLWHFLSPHLSFSLSAKCSVVISKVHYESIIFLEFIQNMYDDSLKVYDNLNNLKFDNVNFEYDFKFYICM
jgi:hypothetical protein